MLPSKKISPQNLASIWEDVTQRGFFLFLYKESSLVNLKKLNKKSVWNKFMYRSKTANPNYSPEVGARLVGMLELLCSWLEAGAVPSHSSPASAQDTRNCTQRGQEDLGLGKHLNLCLLLSLFKTAYKQVLKSAWLHSDLSMYLHLWGCTGRPGLEMGEAILHSP